MSLYEVSDVVPNEGFLVRDLLRSGDPVRVSEKSGSRTLKRWCRIAVRVAPEIKAHILSGVILPLTLETSDTLLDDLRKAEGRVPAKS